MNKVKINSANQKLFGENMLEIGCGNQKHWRDGFNLRMDKIDFGQDIIWDWCDGIPLPDNFCSHIYASHTLEHLPPEKIIFALNECWRVLRKGGELWVIVPHLDQPASFIPCHLTKFTEESFKWFSGKLNPDYENLSDGAGYEVKGWDTIELVKNERPDIHWKAHPRGK